LTIEGLAKQAWCGDHTGSVLRAATEDQGSWHLRRWPRTKLMGDLLPRRIASTHITQDMLASFSAIELS
jgi:hypothetical protein